MKLFKSFLFTSVVALVLITFSCGTAKKGSTSSGNDIINVMTYNILLESGGGKGYKWEERKDRVIRTMKKYNADIIGAQEDWYNQGLYIMQETGFGKVGVSKEDGKPDGTRAHVGIFYNKDRFLLQDSGHFWHSETPDAPSIAWDSSGMRMTNWAKFLDKQTKKQFFFFNTHLDHKGVVARTKSAALIRKKIAEIAGTHPVVLTGDMNAAPDSEPITIYKSFLTDANSISTKPHEGPVGTFNRGEFNFVSKNPIDYIFVSSHFAVLSHKTIDDSENQLYTSDHFPVVTQLQFK